MPDQPISPLVANLITASLTESHRVTNLVIDNLTEERDQLRAELDAVRTQVRVALSGPYMPSPTALERALWPTAEVIARFREVRDAQDS